jgi:hypothetical protein
MNAELRTLVVALSVLAAPPAAAQVVSGVLAINGAEMP